MKEFTKNNIVSGVALLILNGKFTTMHDILGIL